MCSIAGVTNSKEASYYTYLSLHSLQHRGQESAGIVSTDFSNSYIHRKRGMVSEIFNNEILEELHGTAAIGHTRYSTTGGDSEQNIQPLIGKFHSDWVAISHNGNLVNIADTTDKLKERFTFSTTTDTEVILHLLSERYEDLPQALTKVMGNLNGAYSLLTMNKHHLVVLRDPYGFRPLVYGKFNGSHIFASETCAIDLIGGSVKKEIQPGEIVVVDLESGKIEFDQAFSPKAQKRCIFELIYFSRPDSEIFDHKVYEFRKNTGKRLAQEHPVNADIVISVPDSGTAAAIGYAEELKIPFEMGLIRSHYIRTFIQPKQSLRDLGVKLKLNAIKSCIRDKKIVVVDDSLVRGTTSKKIIEMLRDCGAKEIHLRIAAPPTISPCFYGIDTPIRDELIASNKSIKEICQFIKADSLEYLSISGLLNVSGSGFCDSCFSGNYPIRHNQC